MSEQLWSDERVMGRYRDFIECNGAEYANVAWQSVIREMRDDYEAALDGARTAGFDASIADGETLDAWKERCWQAEQENAKHMTIAERCLARAAYNADLETSSRHETLADYYRPKDDLEMVSRRIDKLSDRVAQLEREQRESEGEL